MRPASDDDLVNKNFSAKVAARMVAERYPSLDELAKLYRLFIDVSLRFFPEDGFYVFEQLKRSALRVCKASLE